MIADPRTTTETVQPSRRDAVSDWLDVFVRMLALPRPESQAVRDELEDHLRSRVEDLLITGLSEPEAVRWAVAELGETAALAHGFRNARRSPRRRIAMHVALFAIAGTALLTASTALLQSGQPAQPPASSAQTGAASVFSSPPAEQFGEGLRRYDVSELVHSENPLGFNSEAEQLVDTIISLVESEAWQQNGGDVARISIVGNTLFIDAPAEIHEGVVWTLSALHEDAERIRSQAERAAAEAKAAAEASAAQFLEQQLAHERLAAQKQAERLAELRSTYEQLCERQLELERETYRLQDQQNDLRRQREGDPDSVQKSIEQINDALARLHMDSEINQMRLVRARELLVDLEFAGYESERRAPRAPVAGRPADPFAPSPAPSEFVPTPSQAPEQP